MEAAINDDKYEAVANSKHHSAFTPGRKYVVQVYMYAYELIGFIVLKHLITFVIYFRFTTVALWRDVLATLDYVRPKAEMSHCNVLCVKTRFVHLHDTNRLRK